MEDLMRNVRYSLRQIRRRPGFAAVVVLTLGLGIGANTAIFSVIDGVLLRPLPYEDAQELVLVRGDEGGIGSGSSGASYPDFLDFKSQVASFDDMAGWTNVAYTLTAYGGEPVRVGVTRVTWNTFSMLGVTPAIGRGFSEDDDRMGAADVAVLGHAFWRDRLGAPEDVLGRTLTLDGAQFDVVGVMPEGIQLSSGDIYAPFAAQFGDDFRGNHRMLALARLADGVSMAEADAEVKTVASRLEEMYPADNTDRSAHLEGYLDYRVGSIRPTLWAIFGMVGLVLLIACANVANILLTRATERSREVAVRTALGAGRGHIARQLLVESLLLTTIGGALGVFIAWAGLRALVAGAPAGIPRIGNIGLDPLVLAFAAALTVVTGIVFGLLPSLQAARSDLQPTLKEGGRDGGDLGRARLSEAVVVSEVALAMVAIVAAGLLVNSFMRLQRVDRGFSGADVLVVPLSLPAARYNGEGDPNATAALAFYGELERRVEAIPGVTRVASAYMHPMDGGWESSFSLPGVFDPPEGQRPEARLRPVTPGYFSTVGIRLLEGRDVTDRDGQSAPGVVVVNEAFTRKFFPAGDALGHTVRRPQWWQGLPVEYEIIGVVADVKMDGVTAEVPMAMYFSHPQFPFTDMNLVVATEIAPRAVLPAVQEAIWSLDADLPVENVRTLSELRSRGVAPERFRTLLVSLFGAIALVLSAIGIYGVLSYSVARRTRELGLRVSLGAQRGDVLRLVLRHGMSLTGIGLAAGAVVALLATGFLSGLLFGVQPTDPLTYAVVAAVLAIVALAACLLPALRATRVDPMVALRIE